MYLLDTNVLSELVRKRPNAGDLAAELGARGFSIGTEDVFIGATALQHNLLLVSGNTEHFSRIPGLRVENWFA